MSEKSIFSAVGTLAPSILIGPCDDLDLFYGKVKFGRSSLDLGPSVIYTRFSKIFSVTACFDSQVSDCCSWVKASSIVSKIKEILHVNLDD